MLPDMHANQRNETLPTFGSMAACMQILPRIRYLLHTGEAPAALQPLLRILSRCDLSRVLLGPACNVKQRDLQPSPGRFAGLAHNLAQHAQEQGLEARPQVALPAFVLYG